MVVEMGDGRGGVSAWLCGARMRTWVGRCRCVDHLAKVKEEFNDVRSKLRKMLEVQSSEEKSVEREGSEGAWLVRKWCERACVGCAGEAGDWEKWFGVGSERGVVGAAGEEDHGCGGRSSFRGVLTQVVRW